MRASAWRVHLVIGTLAVVGYFLLPDDWWQTSANAAIGLAGAAGLLVGVRLHRPRRQGLWWMLAGGLVCIAAGDFVYALYERVLHGPAPFPSLADALYLAGCPLIGLGLVLLVRTRTAGRDRVSWIDATIVASGFGLLSWVFLMAPTAGSNDLSWVSRLVALAYPVMRGATSVLRRLAVLVALGLAVAVPAAAQTDPARLEVTAASGHCTGGLPVVDYTVTNQTSMPVSVQTWWVADASVYGIAATHDLGPAPNGAAGSFSLPFAFYATVTVYATATWPDEKITTNASWAIPVADCDAPTSPPTTVVEPPTSTTPTTIGNGNGNGHGNRNTTTTIDFG